jgi:hypothetical protein
MATTKIADRQATQSVDLTAEVTGVLPAANGGSGASDFNGAVDARLGVGTHAATEKTTLVDNDEFPISDSEASNVTKRSKWSTIKTAVAAYITSITLKFSTGAAVEFHNQADQTTNYERASLKYTSNSFFIASEQGGTGTRRDIAIQSATTLTIKGAMQGPTVGCVNVSMSTATATGTAFGIIGTLSASSGVQYGQSIAPTINQSSTGGYTCLLVNPTESATGSGAKNLIDLQVGGTSKFKVDNAGNLTTVGSITVGGKTFDEAVDDRVGILVIDSNSVDVTYDDAGNAETINADITLPDAQTGTSYNLPLSARGKTTTMNNAAANTLTVQTNANAAFPVGYVHTVFQIGAGQTSIAPAGGVTIVSESSMRKIAAQNCAVSLWQYATDSWLLYGALAA